MSSGFFFLMTRRPPRSTRTDTLFPYTTLFRSTPRIAREAGGKDTEIGDTRMGASPAEMHAGLAPPPFLYPLLESAVAHHAGRTLDEQRRFLGRFMAPAPEVAGAPPDLAWFPDPAPPAELRSEEPRVGKECVSTREIR